jgi:hypothetical protein
MAKWEDAPSKSGGWEDAPSRVGSDMTAREQAIAQIPTGGTPTVTSGAIAGEPKFAEKASMYASAVPGGALASQFLKTATAGFPRVAPYTSRLAEALTPTSLRGLSMATGGAAATAIPAEAVRAALERQGVGLTGQMIGEMGTAGVAGLLGAAGKSGLGVVRTAIGGPTKEAAAALQQRTAAQYDPAIAQAQQKAAQAQRVVTQMEQQPKVAGQRAAAAPLTPEQQEAALQAQLRAPVREQAGARRVTAEEQATAAAAEAQAAQQTAAQAQQAVVQLEQRMMAQPTMTAEQFGAELRKTTRKLQQDLMRARSEGANLGQVVQAAGDKPTVDTSGLVSSIKGLKDKTRNPQVVGMLSEIESLAKTGKMNALTLQQADSLRKYLNKDIIAKFFAQTGADKEILKTLRSLRGSLIEATPQAYREALGKFSALSRPLDIVERQGALKRVVDVDAMSTAEKLTEAQVVGEIINKARAGNPVFSRLLETNPALKDSGRLYFTQDLFAKGAVPTEASLRTWLKNNERPLRQLGLYDEFKNMRTARETAQRTVEETKLAEKVATKAATEAGKEATAARKLSEESQRRLESALKTQIGPTPKAPKAVPIQTFIGTREKQQQAVESMTKMQTDISLAKTPKDVKSVVEKTADDLLKRGIINDQGYRTMLKEVENLQSMMDAQSKARKILAYFAGIAGVGYLGRRTAESVVQ